jgi:hypothetical protein
MRFSRGSAASHALVGCVMMMALWSGGPAADADADGARWRSEPAEAPPPPPGVAPAPYPVPVGQVGQISFWDANRGLLITGGTEKSGGTVAAGLYAYDGVSWHQLSTVCGGEEGRIGWVGPDEFWTVSDQRPGQVLSGREDTAELRSISLCHFVSGQVVGSYAMPLQEPGSYLHMDAATCYSSTDCWFGGEDGSSADPGAFHLHWDGSAITAVYEPEDHAVTSSVAYSGEIYESVQIGAEDAYLPSEDTKHPAVIHAIAPEGQLVQCDEVESPFCDFPIDAEGVGPLPKYGAGVSPDALQGFDLATNGSPLGVGATQLWAAANPLSPPPNGSAEATVTILHEDIEDPTKEEQWSQLLPGPDSQSPLPAGTTLGGSTTRIASHLEQGTEDAIAPEPDSTSAWLSLRQGAGRGATVAHLNSAGALVEPVEALVLPEAGETTGYHGEAGPITCPALEDCWLATTDESGPVPGWLFHLSDGSEPGSDGDPFFDGQDGVITYRPPDEGVPVIYPDLPPADDSLANQQTAPAQSASQAQRRTASGTSVKARPLLEHVKSKVVKRRTIIISFTLTTQAHVQLVGRRKQKIVASTPKRLLKSGRHTLSLNLNPAHWPTKIQFLATPIGGAAPVSGASDPGGPEAVQGVSSSDTLET